MDSPEKNASLFKYESHLDFLRDHFLIKTAENPRFTYGAWSRRLGLSNTASLTRWLSGDRKLGAKGEKFLGDYFQFTSKEKEYFSTLIRIQKETDPFVKNLFYAKLKYLRENDVPDLSSHSTQVRPLVELNSKFLLLWGHATPAKINRYLDPFHLQANTILGWGKAIVCLKGALTQGNDLGTYNEFNLAIHVLKKNNPFLMMNMFFDFLRCSEERVGAKWREWGSPFSHSEMQFSFQNPRRANLVLGKESNPELVLNMGASKKKESFHNHSYSINGYNAILSHNYCFRIDMKSETYERKFDLAEDTCRWNSQTPLGKFLDQVGFVPTHWSTHPRFDSKIYPPSPR